MRSILLLLPALVACQQAPDGGTIDGPVETVVREAPERDVASVALLPPGTPLDPASEVTDRFQKWATHTPRTRFSPGIAHPRRVPAARKTERSFAVDFPGRAPIPTPVVHQEVVLSSGGFHGEQMYAYAHASGDALWGLNLSDDGPSSAACEDGVCVFNTESCTVFAVAAASGDLLWSYYLGDPQLSSPSVANGVVYTSYPAWGRSGATHVLAAIDLQTGDFHWQTWLDADVMTAPVVADGGLFLTTFSGTVARLDLQTGAVVAAWDAGATSSPVVLGDAVWFSRRIDRPDGVYEVLAGAGALGVDAASTLAAARKAPWLDARVQSRSAMYADGVALDAGNGFWGAPVESGASTAKQVVGQSSVSTLQAYQGSRPLPFGGLQIATMGDAVMAIDITTGETAWSHPLPGDLRRRGGALGTAPLAAGDNVVVGTTEGEIRVLDPADGRLKKTYAVGHPVRSQPVVQDGWIYVGTADGHLIGIDTGDDELTGWPQWGGDGARTGVATHTLVASG